MKKRTRRNKSPFIVWMVGANRINMGYPLQVVAAVRRLSKTHVVTVETIAVAKAKAARMKVSEIFRHEP